LVVLPDVDDVLDDDRECRQRAEGDAQVCHDGVGDNVGNEESASGATDADTEVAEGIVEVEHGDYLLNSWPSVKFLRGQGLGIYRSDR
jgi:hypothetical protein